MHQSTFLVLFGMIVDALVSVNGTISAMLFGLSICDERSSAFAFLLAYAYRNIAAMTIRAPPQKNIVSIVDCVLDVMNR